MSWIKSGVISCLVLGFLLAACGSDDSGDEGGSGTCSAVCGCVVSEGGNGTTCNDECTATVNSGGDQKGKCEDKLDGFGFPQCKSKCEGFPTS